MRLESVSIKIFHKLKSRFLESGFIKPTLKQRQLAENLKQKVLSLGDLGNGIQMEQTWLEFRKKVRENIIYKDPRNFLNWPVIRSSMFHEPDRAELKFLKLSPNWLKIKIALKEAPAGNPRPFPGMLSSSGNCIHNAYVLEKFLSFFNLDIGKARRIVEFGGGYGSLCRLIYNLGFTGQYVIYDIPEFSLLQEYFLKSWNENISLSLEPIAKNRQGIALLSDLKVMQKQLENFNTAPDIFIATWSLSESPVDLRERILGLVGGSGYIFIAFKDTFSNVNNLDYFKRFAESNSNYDWRQEEIKHLPGNFLLAGKRRGV
jgi:hypothetical protein